MKLNNLKIGIAMLALAATSCDLDRYPLDEISDATYWNTENDLLTYNSGFYAGTAVNTSVLIGHGVNDAAAIGTYYMLDAFSDNLVTTASSSFAMTKCGRDTAPTLASSQYFGYRGWDFLYELNYGLENYDRADVTDEVKNKYIGEARLLRGWFYAVKVQRFGDVQWVETTVNIDDEDILYGERDSREYVMDKVLEDLDAAIEGLPVDWGDGASPGRMHKYLAYAIKARVCLFEGTFRKYHTEFNLPDADKWLELARDASKYLMDNAGYVLDPNYTEVVMAEDLSANTQIIYWRRYDIGEQATRHNAPRYFQSKQQGATRSAAESYLCTDGDCIEDSSLYQGDETLEDTFVNRDPRMRLSLLHPDDGVEKGFFWGQTTTTKPRLQGLSGNTAITGYHVVKHYRSTNESQTSFRTCIEAGVIAQYAEVLLNYAEACAELGECTQDVLDISINLLRDRVGMPYMDLNNLPDDSQAALDGVSNLIYEIRRERRVELFVEGFRYDDLMRWKQGAKLAEKAYGCRWNDKQAARYTADEIASMTFTTVTDPDRGEVYIDPMAGTSYADPVFDETKDYLWPIPLDVIAANPNITQNEGW